jgi:hypothetical protein
LKRLRRLVTTGVGYAKSTAVLQVRFSSNLVVEFEREELSHVVRVGDSTIQGVLFHDTTYAQPG